MKKISSLLLFMLLFVWIGCSSDSGVNVENLRLEMKENPLGINQIKPRFSWQLSSETANLKQTSYQIQVAVSEKNLKSGKDLLWDSGTVSSDQSILVPYAGKELESGEFYYWRVKLQTNQGLTDWSDPAFWSMALLDSSEWKATWIGDNSISNPGEDLGGGKTVQKTRLAARYLRKEFSLEKNVKRAVLYISGLGSNETYLNGNKVTEDIFAPAPSLYSKRTYYNVYDVTNLLVDERNTIGVILGNGRFFSMRNPGMKGFGLPRLLAQLQIEYEDGTKSMVVSDSSWKLSVQGPIVANNEFDGEEYDARKEMPGWNQNGFDDSSWETPDVMKVPAKVLVAQQNPGIRIQEEIKPVSIKKHSNGSYILDMGQNMVGWLAVNLKGKKDQPIKMRFSELLKEDGTLYMDNLRTALVTDIYTPAKDGDFNWHPLFVYHGFRFVEVTGLDYQPELSAFTGQVIYDQMETTGHYKTSNPLVNQVHQNAFWGIRGNYRGMPTDCPQRNERLGWLGDRATGAYGEAFLFNNAQMYNKWLQDIEDSMSPEGRISDVSPSYWTVYSDNVTWPSAFFYVADMLYRQYGDDQAIRRHYPAMKHWMEYMEKKTMKDFIMTKDQYGDWCMPPESQGLIHSKDPSRKTDGAILSTTVYYDLLNKMAEFAHICERDSDIAGYKDLALKMKEAYNAKFFNKETAQYGNNTVTANILSLRLGLVPEGYEGKVFKNIVEKTEIDFKGHVSTGVLGIQHLMRGLTEYGRLDMAYNLLTNESYPSWGYMIKHGATTIWELWNGDTANPAMNSGNHVMLLGDLLIWYYENLAGIKCAPDALAFKRLIMVPVFPEGLDEVSASYESVYGKICSEWSKKDGNFRWHITIPGNTSATVRIPRKMNVKVQKQPGIEQISETDLFTEISITSGSYCFSNQ